MRQWATIVVGEPSAAFMPATSSLKRASVSVPSLMRERVALRNVQFQNPL